MLFTKIYNQIGDKWPKFINAVKMKADKENQSQIHYTDFVHLIKKFGGNLTRNE